MDKTIGVSLIFVGAFCILVGAIVGAMGYDAYIEAQKEAYEALREGDTEDYYDALEESIEGQQMDMVGRFFYGFGFVITFSGIGLYFMSIPKEASQIQQPQQPQQYQQQPQQYQQQPQQYQQSNYRPPQQQPPQPP